MKKIDILWTGGYDSSFRIAQLSKLECVIQPHYLCNNRKSEPQELSAISAITQFIEQHPDTRCSIKPIIKTPATQIQKDLDISAAYQKAHKKYQLGIQYDWLARFANSHPGLELCILNSGGIQKFLNQEARFIKVTDGKITYYVLDRTNSSEAANLLFGNYHLPLLNMTKLQEKALYEQLGLQDIALATWFCHNPVDGQPCGQCNPCFYTIKEGLIERFSQTALKRYRRFRIIKPIKDRMIKMRDHVRKRLFSNNFD